MSFQEIASKCCLAILGEGGGEASLLLERVCAFMARPDSIDRNSTWKSTTTSPRISLDEHSMYVLLNIPLKSTSKRRLQRERLASSIFKWIFRIKDAFDFMRAHSHLLIFTLPLHYYDIIHLTILKRYSVSK